jgi:hypothetical protein
VRPYVSDFSGTGLRRKSSVSWIWEYLGQCLTGDLVEWTVNSLKMNHLISQEWQEIGLRNFVHMIFDARAFECDTFWICWGFQNLTIACSFLVKNCEKWTWYSESLEALRNLRWIAALSLAIPEKLDGSFLMNWLFIRLDLRLNIVQFQKERYSRIQETELFLLRPVPEKSET